MQKAVGTKRSGKCPPAAFRRLPSLLALLKLHHIAGVNFLRVARNQSGRGAFFDI